MTAANGSLDGAGGRFLYVGRSQLLHSLPGCLAIVGLVPLLSGSPGGTVLFFGNALLVGSYLPWRGRVPAR